MAMTLALAWLATPGSLAILAFPVRALLRRSRVARRSSGGR